MSEAAGYHNTLMSLDDVIECIAFRGQPFPPQLSLPLDKKDKKHAVQEWLRIYWRKWAEEKELMPALQTGKLDLLWLSENHLLAELKRVQPIFLSGLSRFDQVIQRVRPDHWRITRDLVFLFDKAQVHPLWPAGKWLTFPEEDLKNFVKAYANNPPMGADANNPPMGADTLHNLLPRVIRKQIPRPAFRTIVQELRSGLPQ